MVYDCPEFPYMCALSGLLRTSLRIAAVAQTCGIDTSVCVVCGDKRTTTYTREGVVHICYEHDRAWGDWLDKHLERRQYIVPKGRARTDAWIEVFREFVEDCR